MHRSLFVHFIFLLIRCKHYLIFVMIKICNFCIKPITLSPECDQTQQMVLYNNSLIISYYSEHIYVGHTKHLSPPKMHVEIFFNYTNLGFKWLQKYTKNYFRFALILLLLLFRKWWNITRSHFSIISIKNF